MTTRAGPSLIPGKTVAGFNTRGVLGSLILADAASGDYGAGVLNNDGLLPGAEYWVLILSSTFPYGTFRLNENGSGEYSAAGTIVYRLYENGVAQVPDGGFAGGYAAPTISATFAWQDVGDDVFIVNATVAANLTATLAWQEQGDDAWTLYAAVQGRLTGAFAFDEERDDTWQFAALVTTAKHPTGHYATEADMLMRFQLNELIQLTNRDRKATAIDALVLDRALSDADAEIDARLAPRYKLPLLTIPRLLVNVACDIARYRLYDDRATEQVTRRYEDALKLLNGLASGKLSLGLDAQADSTPPVDGPSATTPVRIFSADTLRDYRG